MQNNSYKFILLLVILASNAQAMMNVVHRSAAVRLLKQKNTSRCFRSTAQKDLKPVSTNQLDRFENKSIKAGISFVQADAGPRYNTNLKGGNPGIYSFIPFNRTVVFSYIKSNNQVFGYLSDKHFGNYADDDNEVSITESRDESQRWYDCSEHDITAAFNSMPRHIQLEIFDKLYSDVEFFTGKKNQSLDNKELRIETLLKSYPEAYRNHWSNVIMDLAKKNWQDMQIADFSQSWTHASNDKKKVICFRTYCFTERLTWKTKIKKLFNDMRTHTNTIMPYQHQPQEKISRDKVCYLLGISSTATPYEILKISSCATPIEIKEAYLDLVKKWHPDHNQNPDAGAVFQLIQEAYSKIRN